MGLEYFNWNLLLLSNLYVTRERTSRCSDTSVSREMEASDRVIRIRFNVRDRFSRRMRSRIVKRSNEIYQKSTYSKNSILSTGLLMATRRESLLMDGLDQAIPLFLFLSTKIFGTNPISRLLRQVLRGR